MNAMDKDNRKKNLPQRLIALGLCLLMCFQLLPVTVLADTDETEEELAEKKTLMETSWGQLTAPIDDLVTFVKTGYELTSGQERQEIEQKYEALKGDTGIYRRLAEDYYETYAIAADAVAVEEAMEAQLATWTTFLGKFDYPKVEKPKFYEDLFGLSGLRARYKAFEALEGVKKSVSGLVEEVTALKVAAGLPADQTDDELVAAWEELVSAQNAYAAALKTITGFADAYYEGMRAYYTSGATPDQIYDPVQSNIKLSNNENDYVRVQDNFTWNATGGPRTDKFARYRTTNGNLREEADAARDALKDLQSLYNAFANTLQSFYTTSANKTASEIPVWIDQILQWEREYEKCYTDWTTHRFVNTDGKYYATRFPHYNFQSEEMFGSIASSSDNNTYEDIKNGLELAYYIDCESLMDHTENAYMGHNAYLELARSAGEDYSLYHIRERLETVAGIIHNAEQMKDAGEALKVAWTALNDFDVSSAMESDLATESDNATESDPTSAYDKLNDWVEKAGRYNSMLYQYATRGVMGTGAYLGRYTNLIYSVEKLQGMADFYRQEYLEAVENWKNVRDSAENDTSAETLQEQRVAYCVKVVFAQKRLYQQADESVAAAMRVLSDCYGMTLDPKESLAQQIVEQITLMEVKQQDEQTPPPAGDQQDGETPPSGETHTSLENALNPYSNDNLKKLTDDTLGVDAANGITRAVAMRSYLRLQKANLQLWHDISEETVGICANILNKTDDAWLDNGMVSPGTKTTLDSDDIFDLRMTEVENRAYAAYSECMLQFVEEAFEEYDRLSVPEEGGQTSEESDYKAAKEGKEWQEIHKDDVTAWLDAYLSKRASDAKTAYEEKNSNYEKAKEDASEAKDQLPDLKEDMDAAETEKNAAETAYTDLVTELIQKKAAMKEAEGTAQYAEAKREYDSCVTQTDTAFATLKTKAGEYSTAVADYESTKKEYDEKLALSVTLEKERDALQRTWESLQQQTFDYPDVPTIDPTKSAGYTAYTLELMIEEARERIKICQAGIDRIYQEMLNFVPETNATDTENGGNDGNTESVEDAEKIRRGEQIYQFNAYVWEMEGQEKRLADLEKIMAQKYSPSTLEGATYSAELAVEDYYFAQRDFYEFRDLECYMASYLDVEDNRKEIYIKHNYTDTSTSTSFNDVGVSPVEHPEAYTIREAAQIVAGRYQEELEELRKIMSEQEATMNQKLRELQEQEIRYEKTLKTKANINERVNQLQMDLNGEIEGEGEGGDGSGGGSGGKRALFQEAREKVFTDIVGTVIEGNITATTVIGGKTSAYCRGMFLLAAYDMANEENLSWEDFCAVGYFLNTLKQGGGAEVTGTPAQGYYDHFGGNKRDALSAAVRTFGNDKYHKAYIDFKIAEALYGENNEDRNNMIARINRMGDQYALQVNTGSVDGNGVLFFSVAYMDTDGFERKEYIFPFEDGYENTLKEAGAAMAENLQTQAGSDDPTGEGSQTPTESGDPAEEGSQTQAGSDDSTGEGSQTSTESGAPAGEGSQTESEDPVDPLARAVNQGHIDTMAKLGQSGKLEKNPPLQTWSSDIYMFRTQYKMADKTGSQGTPDVLYFETFVERQQFKKPDGTVTGTAKNTWACTAMRLFHLDDFYGVSAYGYGGGPQTQLQLEFKGQRIATLKNNSAEGGSISWVTDELIAMGQTDDKKFSIDHTVEEYSTGKVGPNSGGGILDQVSDEDSEYLFELDFDDSYGAGIEALVNMVTDTRTLDPKLDTMVTAPLPMTVGSEVNYSSNAMGVGIDPSAKTSIWDMGLAECLTYDVVYLDSTGTKRQVSIPVITSSLAWAIDHGVSGDEKIFGYAQQGESIVFSAYLPEMEEMRLDECGLTFNYVNGWDLSGKQSKKATDNFKARESLIKEDVEVRLSGIQVYKPGTYQASAKVVQGRIVPTVTSKEDGEKTPTYYEVKSQNSKGVKYEYNRKTTPDLDDWNGSGTLKWGWDCEDLYMLVIQTDDPPLAGTEASPSVSLNYTTVSGRTKTSRSASLEGDGLDFYGYWPGYENREMTALQATGAKGQLKLLYSLKDDDNSGGAVKSFDSVTISMPEKTNDDWQISGMYIMKINRVGERFAVWENITDSNDNLLSDRRYDRTVNGLILTPSIDTSQGKILLQPGDTKVITFKNDGNPEVITTETDWGSVQYYMDYNTAMGEFGFTKARETYTVKVQVNDEGASTINNGDCGSNNNFYFQLIFANGRSAYVLANQQLSGDGFRTGYVETFNIKTNRDYGELQAVRIIPDDNSSESELFDKLNIKRIRVSKNGNDSVNRTWVITDIGDNGWISFDYHDDAESYGVLGRPGRSESELSINCPVGYVTYSTKLLFALATDPVEKNTMQETLNELQNSGADGDTLKKCAEVMSDNPQYQGQLSMTLLYRNNQGNVESMTVDVVGAMAAYANKVADREERIDSQGNVITGTQYLSTKEYMFRPGHTDRFEIDVSDITEIVSVDLIPTSAATQSSFWKVKSLDVFMLKGQGILNINVNNEYQKTNEMEYLCSVKNVPFTFYCPAANPEKKSFTVTDNRLDVTSEAGETTWTVARSREPESKNDVANIYIYAASATMKADGQVNKLYAQLQYTNSYGQIYKSAMRDMTLIEGVNGGCLFYTAGVDIANISVLNNISAQLTSTENNVIIDHIVVQQIRSGVVISTYTITPGATECILSATCQKRSFMPDNTASGGEIIGRGDKQIVTIGFGNDTETARLVKENRDIGIALRYTSTNDVDATKQVYQSPYIYLTDQEIIAICAGGTAQIEFTEQYVDEIKGIEAFATGGLKADISAVSIESLKAGLEGATDDNYTQRDWYSVIETEARALDIGGQKFNTYKENEGGQEKIVSPYTIELTTGAISPTDSPLEMVLTYERLDSTEGTITFSNIRNNLVSGGFSANQKAVIRVMLNDNVDKVLKVALKPTGSIIKETTEEIITSDKEWSITSLKATLAYRETCVIAPETDLTATTSEYSVFNTAVDGAASLFVSAAYGGNTQSNVVSGDMVFDNVGEGEPVTVLASMSGSADTIVVKVERVGAGESVDVTTETLTGGGGNWKFTSNSKTNAEYHIIISLKNHPEKSETITINYKATEVDPNPIIVKNGAPDASKPKSGDQTEPNAGEEDNDEADEQDDPAEAEPNSAPDSEATIPGTDGDGNNDS